jgi:hypothetical protein
MMWLVGHTLDHSAEKAHIDHQEFHHRFRGSEKPKRRRAQPKVTMASSSTIILEYICPTLGCIMANIMFAGT